MTLDIRIQSLPVRRIMFSAVIYVRENVCLDIPFAKHCIETF
jgi:hypothetical protein